MKIQTKQIDFVQLQKAIEAFKETYPQAFYYVESIQQVRLGNVKELAFSKEVSCLRLFTQEAELQVRALQTGYVLVEMNSHGDGEQLQSKQVRTVKLAADDKRLVIEILEHPHHGLFEHWKEVI